MTLIEVINKVDTVKPNGYSEQEKIGWLSTLDGIVKAEIIDTHEGAEKVSFKAYDATTPLSTELLIPHPYDDIYVRWLESQIDYANGEYGKYNNSISLYNTAYTAYEKYYNRTHMPVAKNFTHF